MDLQISCEQYARMSSVAMYRPIPRNASYDYLKALYIERKSGRLFLIATNISIAAIEYIGDQPGPDESTAIVVDEALQKQCTNEIPFGSTLHVVANPMLPWTSLKTTFGYEYPGNADVPQPGDSHFYTWREWLPDDLPKKSHGAMFWTVEDMEVLAKASVTAYVTFPSFIDTDKPVIINDVGSPNWIGLFIGRASKTEMTVNPASIPAWSK